MTALGQHVQPHTSNHRFLRFHGFFQHLQLLIIHLLALDFQFHGFFQHLQLLIIHLIALDFQL